MTIKECRARKREYKRMLANLEILKLALIRSIAIEDLNIHDLKENGETPDESVDTNNIS